MENKELEQVEVNALSLRSSARRRGFIFIRMLTTIIIVFILIVSIIYSVIINQNKERDLKRKADMEIFVKGLQAYYIDNGRFPEADLFNSSFGKDLVLNNFIYIQKVPQEEKAGMLPYCYQVSNKGRSYTLLANLENSFDPDYKKDAYACNGVKGYSYGISSPNVDIGEVTNEK
jgi:competence protein ComGC